MREAQIVIRTYALESTTWLQLCFPFCAEASLRNPCILDVEESVGSRMEEYGDRQSRTQANVFAFFDLGETRIVTDQSRLLTAHNHEKKMFLSPLSCNAGIILLVGSCT